MVDEFYPEFLKTKRKVQLEYVKNSTGIPINLYDNPLNLRKIGQIFQFDKDELTYELEHFTLKNIRCMCHDNLFKSYSTSDCNTAFIVAICAYERNKEPQELSHHKGEICLYISTIWEKYARYFNRFDTGKNLYRGIYTVSEDKKVSYQPLTLQSYAFNAVQYPIWKKTGVACYRKIERIIWEYIFKE